MQTSMVVQRPSRSYITFFSDSLCQPCTFLNTHGGIIARRENTRILFSPMQLLLSGRWLSRRPVALVHCSPWRSQSTSCRGRPDYKNSGALRLLFFGTDQFALNVFKQLEAQQPSLVSQIDVCCLNTKHVLPQHALEQGLRMFDYPPDIVHLRNTYHMGIVASFGKLIPKSIIEAFPRGILNVHASMLPRWRGAAPISHAIINGDTETGVSILKIEPHHFDIGHVLLQKACPLPPDATRSHITTQLAQLGGELLTQVLHNFEHYEGHKVIQDESMVTYAPVICKSLFYLDVHKQTAKDIYNLHRGIGDMGKFLVRWLDTGADLRLANMIHPEIVESLELPEAAKPGLVVSIRKGKQARYICIKCLEGWISFSDFFYEKKRGMDSISFYAGFMGKYKGQRQFYVAKSNR